MKKTLSCLIIMSLLLATSTLGWGQFKVVAYQPYWAGSAGSIQYSKLTHINYSFALPTSDGHLKPISNPSMLQQIVSNAHAVGTKVYIAIGGWSDNGTVLDPTFESLASTSQGRTNLVNDAMALVNTYNLDGVDIDWEYPNAGASANNFLALMQQLSAALKPKGKGLSAAVSAGQYNGGAILSSVFPYVDHLNLMAYDNDQEANHSSYAFAQSSLNYWVGQRGLPKEKAVLGVPFYGNPGYVAYKDLLARGASPNSDQFGNIYYNGIPTIQSKTQLAWNSGGGIMIWELSQDATGTNSLLSAIDTKVKSLSGGTTNKNPTVSITSPANGATFNAPASVTISANAADSDGSISKVEFYNGSTLLASDNTAPYSYTWSNVAAGSYTITAKAYDNSTGTASASVSITVNGSTSNIAPTVSLTSPANGASFTAPATVNISANAADADGSISKVEFYNGSTLLFSDNSTPYSYSWTNVAAGSYTITAKAYDNAGATATSSAATITVTGSTGSCTDPAWSATQVYTGGAKVSYNGRTYQAKWWTQGEQPDLNTGDAKPWQDLGACGGGSISNQNPSASITSPANGASFSAPASMTISASASDGDGTISKVEFYNGSTLLSTDNASPYSYSWNNVAAGNYTLSVKAYDNLGAVTTSSAVAVTVNGGTSGGSCSGVPQYSASGGYTDGSKVQNEGNLYECKPWPYSGWCNGSAAAYAPGTGSHWQDAWTLTGSCASASPAAVAEQGIASPNPAYDANSIEYSFNSSYTGTETLLILSSGGYLLRNEPVHVTQGLNTITIDVSKLQSGIYQIKVGKRSLRFVK